MTRVLVTGGGGFVGRAMVARLIADGYEVTVSGRSDNISDLPTGVRVAATGTLDADTNWRPALAGADAVVHLAARVHVMRDKAADPLALFRRVNTAATKALCRQAAEAGVKRLVFVSSVKALGERTPERPYSEGDTPSPLDPYGVSKWEAEQAVAAVAAETALETVILRPPLVYGPDVKGNFASLIGAIDKGWPLPLALVEARRSLISVTNLVNAIAVSLRAPAAAGETFMVCDGEAVSVRALIDEIGKALGRPARLLPVPSILLRLGGLVTGRNEAIGRLLDTLMVDDRKIRSVLNWQPPETLRQGLAATVRQHRRDRPAGDGKRNPR